MKSVPIWKKLLAGVSSLLSFAVCGAIALVVLGIAVRIAKNSPVTSSMPLFIIGLFFIFIFGSAVVGFIRRP
ncbi:MULTISPECIES: hypothetical protein [unclassified Sphingopyxis]|uniref:hypothetical protein n=1 Tax=unclassified Sphingopyxis TaxID=2614943 RepID=UPI00072FE43D|nr:MULTISPECIES: hypothetical protein [unclassified Sphingopyxis]KTE25375.1 hypothetical protein ATE61_09825 [Sphingopyxis sp. H057]KTE53396.1 hypothetical protein ATE64_05755 [Sphingopyxis sp. H073]KTE55987.1 hypothetical protein ATE69_05740 [Sphingopyxis sp. H071]KTE60927.1 hypothetical protein ATE65_18690 [Sphingopyxis sp. H100]KTE62900.1 hypothetical protein ATE66_00785 [Sphingopyxis sp. H107]